MAQKAVLDAANLAAWLGKIKGKSSVMAPVKRGRASFAFSWIDDAAEVRLDYVRTVLSPKQAFMPSREPLMTVQRNSLQVSATLAKDPFVLFGIHPCDLMAVNQLDWSMTKRHNVADPYYRARREAATIVAVDCMPDKYCFCTSVGSCGTREGADIFMTPTRAGHVVADIRHDHLSLKVSQAADGYLVEGLTDRGNALLASAKLRKPSAGELAQADAFAEQKRRRTILKIEAPAAELPSLFDRAYSSEVWENTAKRCYSCGTCTNVCPTCFCFDVRELADLTLETATRWRQYDSCQFADFALVAGGHNFRGDRPDRVRHRWFRKFVHLNREHGQPFCVGCGRCSQQCTAGISLVDVINSVIAEAKEKIA